jgi:hypothetical protein
VTADKLSAPAATAAMAPGSNLVKFIRSCSFVSSEFEDALVSPQ